MSETTLDKAIAYARGDGYFHLAELEGRDKDIAELGARRAIAFLEERGLVVPSPTKKEDVDGNG